VFVTELVFLSEGKARRITPEPGKGERKLLQTRKKLLNK